jgi:hypothetical protein
VSYEFKRQINDKAIKYLKGRRQLGAHVFLFEKILEAVFNAKAQRATTQSFAKGFIFYSEFLFCKWYVLRIQNVSVFSLRENF